MVFLMRWSSFLKQASLYQPSIHLPLLVLMEELSSWMKYPMIMAVQSAGQVLLLQINGILCTIIKLPLVFEWFELMFILMLILVRIYDYWGNSMKTTNSAVGVATQIASTGCCNTGVEQLMYFTDTSK